MPKTNQIVINTGPLLALIAGLGDLKVLDALYERVLVPYEVCQEILAGGSSGFGIHEFNAASFLIKHNKPSIIQPYLLNSLDLGESSVIQTALDEKIRTVCIDEAMGRRIARLNDLALTGSLGIMIRAKKEGLPIILREAINQMQAKGIRLGEQVINFALNQVYK
jgi:predicted nucleic acid-binding protein